MPDNPTDFQRWADVTDTWGEKHPLRARIVAQFIGNRSSVLDLGAGSMVLRQFLRPGCRYQPCDLYPRSPDCLVADLNAGQFPGGRYDWVAMLGVFQFLQDPAWAVRQCRQVAQFAAFSYSPTIREVPTPKEIQWREGEGWVNHYNYRQYLAMVSEGGWVIGKIFRIPANFVLICRAGESGPGGAGKQAVYPPVQYLKEQDNV